MNIIKRMMVAIYVLGPFAGAFVLGKMVKKAIADNTNRKIQ